MDVAGQEKQLLKLIEAVAIDAICEDFERRWKPEISSSITQLLADVEENLRSELLHELLLTDLENREKSGCGKTCEFYIQMFPEFRNVVLRACEAALALGWGPRELEIGRYQIRDEIGQGGMGRVYRAFDLELKREVAIKTMHPRIAAHTNRINRFKNEITSVANLSHPNIVTLHDVVHRGDTTYAVMELLTGEDLSERLSVRNLGWAEALVIFDQVANGLGFAHQKGIIHRDIKPANIFLIPGSNAKILDFGVARLKESAQVALGAVCDDTGVGTIVGTADYMSPEQVRGEEVDARSDIFSLGSVLFEMVTGRKAFRQSTAADTRAAVLTQEISFTSSDAIPKQVEQLIQRCLRKAPNERYQTVDELRQASAAILQGRGEPRTPTRNFVSLRMLGALAATAVLVALVWLSIKTTEATSAPLQVQSLAVLPFLGESEGGNQKENLTFSLTNSLAKLEGLAVRPFSLVYNSYQDNQPLQLRQIASDLEVDAVLTGIVNLDSNDKLSIHIELFDPARNRLLWGEDYVSKADDLLTVQDLIAADIGKHLGIDTGFEQTLNAKPLTKSLAAFEQFVHGQVALSERRPQSVRRALESFKRAIELDVNFEAAYVGLANCFIVQSERNVVAPVEGYEKARMYANKALDINSASIDAQIALAMIEFEYDWSFSAAEKRFRRALNLEESQDNNFKHVVHPTGHQWFAEFLSATGRYKEALIHIRIAQKQAPTSVIVQSIEGLIHLKAREFEKAVAQLIDVLDKFPNFERARGYLIDVFEVTQQIDRALIQWTALAKSHQAPVDMLKTGFRDRGSDGYWEQRFLQDKELNQIRAVSPLFRAHVLTKNDQQDQAIKLIEQLRDQKNGALAPNLLVHPFFEPLREVPEFGATIQAMGLGADKVTTGTALNAGKFEKRL